MAHQRRGTHSLGDALQLAGCNRGTAAPAPQDDQAIFSSHALVLRRVKPWTVTAGRYSTAADSVEGLGPKFFAR